MNNNQTTKARELSLGEVVLVSGGEINQQGGRLPTPEGPLPIFADLP
jgi:hypothetical protein